MTAPAVITSDHALVRYMERVLGMDLDVYRRELESLAAPYVRVGAHAAPIGGLWLVFDGSRIVTVTPVRPAGRTMTWHQKAPVNGDGVSREPLPWQGRKRKRRRH